ncbi:MAG: hypothetical protein ACR2OD_09435 [Gaiellaceae bacterium]
MTISKEARGGLARAWLALLREQHQGTTWMIVNNATDEDADPGAEEASQPAPATRTTSPG